MPSASRHRTANLQPLRTVFGERLQRNASMSRYTAARIGGRADWLLILNTSDELALAATQLWQLNVPFAILGGGANVLISDAGIRGLVLINRAQDIRFNTDTPRPTVWAESGANFGVLARKAAALGLGGLEWAANIPGTLGGAIIGNAGAHGGDMAGSLLLAEILHQTHMPQETRGTKPLKPSPDADTGPLTPLPTHRTTSPLHLPEPQILRETWPVDRFHYDYRYSVLKNQSLNRSAPRAIVLTAQMHLERSTPEVVQANIDSFNEKRRRSQPPGASMGSMFKNPPGDYAGRLIEIAGLKGARVGDAQISTIHANFFINRGNATAANMATLIQLTRKTVWQNFGVELELEVELLGEWN
jgi:UDP-N-acetylmuramate dehydrogenase